MADCRIVPTLSLAKGRDSVDDDDDEGLLDLSSGLLMDLSSGLLMIMLFLLVPFLWVLLITWILQGWFL